MGFKLQWAIGTSLLANFEEIWGRRIVNFTARAIKFTFDGVQAPDSLLA